MTNCHHQHHWDFVVDEDMVYWGGVLNCRLCYYSANIYYGFINKRFKHLKHDEALLRQNYSYSEMDRHGIIKYRLWPTEESEN